MSMKIQRQQLSSIFEVFRRCCYFKRARLSPKRSEHYPNPSCARSWMRSSRTRQLDQEALRLRAGVPADFLLRAELERVLLTACALCALRMAGIKPGNRFSSSSQREVFCISTPRRSPRIRPASLRALKCWDNVDLGISFSLTRKKLEQLCEQSEPSIPA